MHCIRWVNPPRHFIDKYLIVMHLKYDVIMITFEARWMRRETDILVFNDRKTGDYEQIFHGAFNQTPCFFYIVQLIFL